MTDKENVLIKRRALTDAMHAMHPDHRLYVSEELARRLEKAWNEYDAAIVQAAIDNGRSEP